MCVSNISDEKVIIRTLLILAVIIAIIFLGWVAYCGVKSQEYYNAKVHYYWTCHNRGGIFKIVYDDYGHEKYWTCIKNGKEIDINGEL